MGETCKESEDLKSEMEALQEESHAKSELAETLWKAHDEARAEIAAKDDEIASAKRLYDDLRSSFAERTNSERGEKEKTISAFKEEIEGLKRLLFEARRKCSDAEERAQAPREGVGLERSNLVGEIHALQTKLDSTTRLNEGLKSQLAMCNQALAREESRRKMLEAQVSELKERCENVVSEFEEARSAVELLTTKRDEEIASLRNLLATKITLLKEMEYNKAQLEQENQELRSSLKEYKKLKLAEQMLPRR
uniref:Uncharacterized protein n=1 Tax=Ananas comosus var. bracteatus TaxID=296719 RepID=A0A6V7QBI9_ANACO|nr:unnamed protein product [Ananas comosus var. bracteatus]